jgi:large conductance mechanosensitive channel
MTIVDLEWKMLDLDDFSKVEELVHGSTRKFLNDFRGFVFKQNTFALAIGVVLGAAANSFVQALIADLVMPMVNLLFKNQAWRVWGPQLSEFVNDKGEVVKNRLLLGDLMWQTFNLLVVSLVAYVVYRTLTRTVAPATPPAPPQRQCPFCLEQVQAAASRCRYCTSPLSPVDPAAANAPVS